MPEEIWIKTLQHLKDTQTREACKMVNERKDEKRDLCQWIGDLGKDEN